MHGELQFLTNTTCLAYTKINKILVLFIYSFFYLSEFYRTHPILNSYILIVIEYHIFQFFSTICHSLNHDEMILSYSKIY